MCIIVVEINISGGMSMRLWHKDLIEVLPRQQLLGQWRECCLIAKSVKEKGTSNHILVNRVMNYPIVHFYFYGVAVYNEMYKRGYRADFERFKQHFNADELYSYQESEYSHQFENWHDDRYLRECLCNLEEKAICGGIPYDEWRKIYETYGKRFDLWKS
jgi:uncharacterized protein (TIGR02328 family)